MSTLEDRLLAKAVDAPTAASIAAQVDRSRCSAPFNHDWDDIDSQVNPQGGGHYLSMRCTRCGKKFKQIINDDGSLHGGRRYIDPPGWQKMPTGWTRSDWRREFLSKLNGRR